MMQTLWALFWHFVVISLLAFGGGKAALPLIERVSVAQMAWITPTTFAAAVGFGYLAPGPILILATFIGYQAAGLPGAVVATIGVFLMPTLLAAGAALWVEKMAESRWLRAFGESATFAVIGLLGATCWNLGRSSITAWPLEIVVVVACSLTMRTKITPGWMLMGGALIGWFIRSR